MPIIFPSFFHYIIPLFLEPSMKFNNCVPIIPKLWFQIMWFIVIFRQKHNICIYAYIYMHIYMYIYIYTYWCIHMNIPMVLDANFATSGWLWRRGTASGRHPLGALAQRRHRNQQKWWFDLQWCETRKKWAWNRTMCKITHLRTESSESWQQLKSNQEKGFKKTVFVGDVNDVLYFPCQVWGFVLS